MNITALWLRNNLIGPESCGGWWNSTWTNSPAGQSHLETAGCDEEICPPYLAPTISSFEGSSHGDSGSSVQLNSHWLQRGAETCCWHCSDAWISLTLGHFEEIQSELKYVNLFRILLRSHICQHVQLFICPGHEVYLVYLDLVQALLRMNLSSVILTDLVFRSVCQWLNTCRNTGISIGINTAPVSMLTSEY